MRRRTPTALLIGRMATAAAATALLALTAVFIVHKAHADNPPPAPTSLTGTATGNGITLSWTPPSQGGVTGYQILRRLTAEDWVWSQAVYVDDTGNTATSYTDAGVEAGEEYHYRVKARYGDDIGRWSNGANVRATAANSEPASAPSDDATLRSLELSGIAFGFDPATHSYDLTVANEVAETTITVETSHESASYEFAMVIAGGYEGNTVSLAEGSNLIYLSVTAEDGETTANYVITVTRAAPPSTDATLNTLALSGVNFGTFDPATTGYTASVANDVSETTVTPTVNDDGAAYVVKLDGTEDADGTVALAVGNNVVTVEVTAEDGQTTKTYTVTVDRAGPSLTAEFEKVPAEHNGTDPFTFRIAFSEDISTSYVTMRDQALEVTGGSVAAAWRVDRQSDLWGIRVQPDSGTDVSIALPADRACDTQGAVCTADDRTLSNWPETTVPGPPPASPGPNPDRSHLYNPIHPPMAPAHIWWNWDSNKDHFREMVIEFTIHNDVGDWSDDHGHYLLLLYTSISDTAFYFGLQTDADSREKQ